MPEEKDKPVPPFGASPMPLPAPEAGSTSFPAVPGVYDRQTPAGGMPFPSMPGSQERPVGGMSFPPVPPPPDPKRELERKVVDLEKRLQEEREKVLLANLKSQEEATYSARVETAIKEVQEKLRRDRHEAETEESRFKLEAKIQELEQRLIQERETWVSTLKGQVLSREVQDKEIEVHFTSRLQEMERRWLEEKAHWQKSILAKEEENRNLRSLAEKLKGVEVDYHKELGERKPLEERVAVLSGENVRMEARLRALEEKERELFQVKAELSTVREQARMQQERFDRDLAAARAGLQEREERLLSDNRRLQQEVQTIAERVRHEAGLETQKHKVEANAAQSALQKLRAVAGALERQTTSLKSQAEQGAKAKAELDHIDERRQLELRTFQQRAREREEEIRRVMEEETRHQLEDQAKEWLKTLDVERQKIRVQAEQEAKAKAQSAVDEAQSRILPMQEEMNDRLRQLRTEHEQQLEQRLADRERRVREETDRLTAQRLEHKELELAERAAIAEKLRILLAQEGEAVSRLAQEKEALEKHKEVAESRKEYLEKQKDALEKNVEALRATSAGQEGELRRLSQEKEGLEKTVVGVKEELRNVSGLRRREEAARRELEKKIRVLSGELERAKAPQGLLERMFGTGAPIKPAGTLRSAPSSEPHQPPPPPAAPIP